MLQLRNIRKTYTTGDFTQVALDGVSLDLRDNEFVAILGPSGSGKTTLLNIIGGLDRYETGDLIINGTSTKEYHDRDWDAYRNHTIGFVFQSYNLIPHQTVLANVELALTISGVSKSERRRRAQEALVQVGLGDHINKRPNQLSGGQMQRVAIARALVNDPHIVLADEPTGALDSETSVQIMELLKEVARDRLVVMVTHNPELAEQYATRIVRLKDGVIVGDSRPVGPEEQDNVIPVSRSLGKASMSFATSLSLSFKNLWTKKARTLLTAFAGSIGIIGIALILSLSTGVNKYISDIQQDAMNAYPIIINAETVDMSSLMSSAGLMASEAAEIDDSRDKVYANNSVLEMDANMNASITENDLTAFKNYLDDPDSDIRQYLGGNGIVYTYDVNFDVLTTDTTGVVINTNRDTKTSLDDMEDAQTSSENSEIAMNMNPMLAGSTVGAENFEEIIPGADDDTLVSPVVSDSYDVVAGSWPDAYNEVVLVMDDKNSISSSVLYQIGVIDDDTYDSILDALADNKKAEEPSWTYDDLLQKTFRLVPVCDYYIQNDDGTFSDTHDDAANQQTLYDNGIPLTVSGIIRPKDGSENASLQSAIGYTRALTDYLIDYTDQSAVVKAQEATPDTNVLTGVEFTAADDAAKAADAKAYMENLGISEKASLYGAVMAAAAQSGAGDTSAMAAMGSMSGDETTMASALDAWLASDPDQQTLVDFYDQYLGDVTYEDNLTDFGKVSLDAPYSISIYTDTFEDKEGVTACIDAYNADQDEDHQITYTDYVALLTNSLTSMVNVVTYVLIAFVAVSLIVSCIMIGIITHISVLERTKEIGILRAIGASKRNISQVFNAETLIIGLCSGLLGVGISVALTYPINAILDHLIESTSVTVYLPVEAGAILVAISVVITMLGGIIPARNAAKQDPVIALRSE